MDAIIGGVILGVGLSALLSVGSRAIRMQGDGEHRIVAAWLADELLATVLLEGPDDYPKLYDTRGAFDEPFGNYQYELEIEGFGVGVPHRVVARVFWPTMGGYDSVEIEADIFQRVEPQDYEEPTRTPPERLDRSQRWDEIINGFAYEDQP